MKILFSFILLFISFGVMAQETPKGDTVESVKVQPEKIIAEKTLNVRVFRVSIVYHPKDLPARKNKAGNIVRPEITAGEISSVEVEWIVIGSEEGTENILESANKPADCRALLTKIGLSK